MERSDDGQSLELAFRECIDDAVQRYGGGGRRARLRLARKLLGFTQQEFAVAFDLNPMTVRNWESESRQEPNGPSGVLIDLIADNPRSALAAVDRAKARRNRDNQNTEGDLKCPS